MFPLYDRPKISGETSWIIISLIIINGGLFFITMPELQKNIMEYGLIPEAVFKQGKFFTLFSSMFLHGSIGHLLGNMWFLWIFGNNLEKKLGKWKFLLFYLLCGVISGLAYLLLASNQGTPAVGASGAISGVLGGYLILFPKNRVVSIVPIFFILQIMAVPAIIFVGIWFLYQLLYIGGATSVAYWAHIGGFVAGLGLIKLFVSNSSYYQYWIQNEEENY